MTRNASGTESSIADLETRDVRALTECMSVLGRVGRARDATGLYLVVSESGSEYLVDVLGGTCECPDSVHRGVKCKHRRAAEFASGRREIPAWVDRSEINNTLGAHIESGPVFADELEPEPAAIAEPTLRAKPERAVMADGGVVSGSEPQGESDEDEPACVCELDPDGLGCFAHYELDREGVREHESEMDGRGPRGW